MQNACKIDSVVKFKQLVEIIVHAFVFIGFRMFLGTKSIEFNQDRRVLRMQVTLHATIEGRKEEKPFCTNALFLPRKYCR